MDVKILNLKNDRFSNFELEIFVLESVNIEVILVLNKVQEKDLVYVNIFIWLSPSV